MKSSDGQAGLLLLFGIIVPASWIYLRTSSSVCTVTKDSQVESDLKTFDSALAMYRLNAGSYPSTGQGLKSLCEEPLTPPAPRRWSKVMDTIPLDPWGNPYVYRFVPEYEHAEPKIFSMGPDGRAGTRDDVR